MKRLTIKELQERLQSKEAILDHYRTLYNQLASKKGEEYAQQSVISGSIKAATELAQANAKLTYAISRVIEVANKVR